MEELLTAARMRAIEQAAITGGEVTGLELMERAGRGVVEAILEEWPTLKDAPGQAVVLCGPGNNGGDGFVVARLLRDRGWKVKAFLYGDPAKLPPDARVNHDRWTEAETVFLYKDNEFRLDPELYGEGDLIIDALFGTGLIRPANGFGAFMQATRMSGNRSGARVVAVDIASGICSDSGRYLRSSDTPRDSEGCQADLTVSFHARKAGHALAEGAQSSGRVVVKDIGLGCSPGPSDMELLGKPSRQAWPGKETGNKYSHGHALVFSGGAGRTGAARLAARGALRMGAGLVTMASPPSALLENAAGLTAIMLRRAATAEDLTGILEDARISALCLGPGMGVGDRTRAVVAQGLKSGRPSVLDADALTLIGDDASLFAGLHEHCILTPHGGEFRRLFPDIAAKLDATPDRGPAYSKADATREAARRAGCTVLFKGPDTVIAGSDGRCSINAAFGERAAHWLATAGSGDVLAGFVTGLLARGAPPMEAAETAAWLHVECALSFGPGLVAEDLPEELPGVLRRLGV